MRCLLFLSFLASSASATTITGRFFYRGEVPTTNLMIYYSYPATSILTCAHWCHRILPSCDAYTYASGFCHMDTFFEGYHVNYTTDETPSKTMYISPGKS